MIETDTSYTFATLLNLRWAVGRFSDAPLVHLSCTFGASVPTVCQVCQNLKIPFTL